MAQRRFVLVALLALIVGTVSTQTQTQNRQAQDVQSLLQAAAKNMGTDTLKSIQYTGSGMVAAPGQGFDAVPSAEWVGIPEHWPRFAVTDYTKTIDYASMSSREVYTQTPPAVTNLYPGLDLGGAETGNQSDPLGRRGGGGIDNPAPRRVDMSVSGKVAWDVQGNDPVRQASYLNGIDAAEFRQLEIVMDPHGFLKAALAPGANPTIITGAGGGGPTRVLITALGKYKVVGTLAQNLVTDTQTWVPNPVVGDMEVTFGYTRWKDFGGVKFYGDNHAHYRADGRHDPIQLRILTVKANPAIPANTLAVPAAVQQAPLPRVTAQAQRLADGVWMIGGGSHNSVAVEFRDFIAVVEAPLNDERSLAVIAEIKRTIPNKPIRYVINTHQHWDHSGGLRAYVAEGAQIVTHENNIQFYRDVLFAGSRSLQPDTLSKREEAILAPVRPQIVGVTNRYLITDHAWGSDVAPRMMEVYLVSGGSPPATNHDEWMLVAYLPTEKILINADLYSPPAAGAKPPVTAPEGVVAIGQLIRANRLNVAQHVPIHGRPGTQEEFAKILGNAVPFDSHGPLILASPTGISSQ